MMSTRSQLQVIQEGLRLFDGGMWDASITLYHHSDGYPENIVPLIQKAYELSGGDWQAGRAGKVASFLCAVDPGEFEPEEGHDLHGDIEYLYKLYLINDIDYSQPSTRSLVPNRPVWEVEILVPADTTTFWNDPSEDTLRIERARAALATVLVWSETR